MNTQTVDKRTHYHVAWASIKKVKGHVRTVFHAVPIHVLQSDRSATVVALVTSVPLHKFSEGGEVLIVSPSKILSASGIALGGPTTFALTPGGRHAALSIRTGQVSSLVPLTAAARAAMPWGRSALRRP